jgi:hypothetical protein
VRIPKQPFDKGGEFNSIDLHASNPPARLRISFPLFPDSELEQYLSAVATQLNNLPAREFAKRVLTSPVFADKKESFGLPIVQRLRKAHLTSKSTMNASRAR